MNESTPTTHAERDAPDLAREQGQQLKGSAQDAASNVRDTAGAHARDLSQQTRSHARNIAGDASQQLWDRAEQETGRAGSALAQAGSQLQALAEGRTDDAGVFGDYAGQAAQAVNRWADAVQDRGLGGLLDDLRSVARRRPGAFLVGAVAAGVIAGRFGRNLREEMSDGSASQQVRHRPTSTPGLSTGAPGPSNTSGLSSSGTASPTAPTDPPTTPPPTTPPRPGRTAP